jgi:hypothetical protein
MKQTRRLEMTWIKDEATGRPLRLRWRAGSGRNHA